MDVKCPGHKSPLSVECLVCWLLHYPVSVKEEKQGLQKDVPSERSSTKSTMNQDELGTIPINFLWINKIKNKKRKLVLKEVVVSEDMFKK